MNDEDLMFILKLCSAYIVFLLFCLLVWAR